MVARGWCGWRAERRSGQRREAGWRGAHADLWRRPPLEPTNSVLPVGADGLQLPC